MSLLWVLSVRASRGIRDNLYGVEISAVFDTAEASLIVIM